MTPCERIDGLPGRHQSIIHDALWTHRRATRASPERHSWRPVNASTGYQGVTRASFTTPCERIDGLPGRHQSVIHDALWTHRRATRASPGRHSWRPYTGH